MPEQAGGKQIAVIGTGTTHGGAVLAGSATTRVVGTGVARVGDPVSCPIHGATTIVSGITSVLVDTKVIATQGSVCGCGAVLL